MPKINNENRVRAKSIIWFGLSHGDVKRELICIPQKTYILEKDQQTKK